MYKITTDECKEQNVLLFKFLKTACTFWKPFWKSNSGQEKPNVFPQLGCHKHNAVYINIAFFHHKVIISSLLGLTVVVLLHYSCHYH